MGLRASLSTLPSIDRVRGERGAISRLKAERKEAEMLSRRRIVTAVCSLVLLTALAGPASATGAQGLGAMKNLLTHEQRVAESSADMAQKRAWGAGLTGQASAGDPMRNLPSYAQRVAGSAADWVQKSLRS